MQKKYLWYILAFVITTIIASIFGLYLSNWLFVTWQKIPKEYLSFTTIMEYKKTYIGNAKLDKVISACELVGVVFVVAVNAFLAFCLFANRDKKELHGSARFANMSEIKQTGLILNEKEREKKFKGNPSKPSILIGKYKGKFLEFFGNEFCFVSAPTRSGKGVGIVIPNLLHYKDSCVVLDVKNENWNLTAGFRSKYQECFLFSPSALDGKSHRYNPLDYINRSEYKRMSDIQNIANIMFPANGDDAYWQSQSQKLFTGLVLFMLETKGRPVSMSELVKLTSPSKPLNEWIIDTINDRQKDGYKDSYGVEQEPLSVECIEALMSFAGNDSENTRSGILSSMTAPLNVFADPMVACATECSDFRLDEVRKKRMTIYVGIQPNELPRFDKLLNLFFSQLINLNTQVLPEDDASLKYQCLVLLDEFTALGRVEIIEKAVAYIAGYNMRLMPIFQNRSQAETFYKKEGTTTLLINMAVQIMFAPRNIEDAEQYSKMLGNQTVKGKSHSRNRGGKGGGGGSVSTSDQQRALMLPQELLELEKSKEIIKYDANKPIICEKIIYHEEPVFQSRLSKERNEAGHQKGLPISKKSIPPTLDLKAMLDVMRGLKPKDINSVNELKEAGLTGKKLLKDNPSYLAKTSSELGLGDIFNFFDSLPSSDKSKSNSIAEQF